MKKYFLLLVAMLFALSACEKKWVSSQDISVYSTRINLADVYEKDFTVTVFSNQNWTAIITLGADWLRIKDNGGTELGFVHVHADANMGENARVGKLTLRAASGAEKIVNIVQSGENEKAADIPDDLL